MIGRGLLTSYVREGMPLLAMVFVNAPGLGGLTMNGQYLAGLRIEHPSGNSKLDLVVPAIGMVEQDLGSLGYQILIGRDILARCQFLYDGPANTFSLTY